MTDAADALAAAMAALDDAELAVANGSAGLAYNLIRDHATKLRQALRVAQLVERKMTSMNRIHVERCTITDTEYIAAIASGSATDKEPGA